MGLLTLPNNIISIVLLFNGLSMSTAVLRYCAIMDDEREKKAYFKFAVEFGLIFDILLILCSGALLFVLNLHIYPVGARGTLQGLYPITGSEAKLIFALAFTPFLAFLFDIIQLFLRAERDNRNYSKTSVIFTASFGIFQVVFVLLLQVYGIVAGRYLAYAVSIAVGLWILSKKPVLKVKALKLRKNEKTAIIKFSANVLMSNCFSLIMPYIETFIVSYFVVSDSLKAEFTTASLPPQSIQFLTGAVVVYIFPFFAKNYKDGKWLLKNSKKLYLALIAGIGTVVAVGMLITPLIVKYAYGANYDTPQEISLMRVFWVAFGVNSALKMPTGNILAAIGEVRFNTINAMASTVVQVAICWVLISRFALGGAAYGLLTGYLVSSVVGIIYLIYYCKKLVKRHDEKVPEVQIEDDAS
jgi:O-antigen/teichoic acid export membrane protein